MSFIKLRKARKSLKGRGDGQMLFISFFPAYFLVSFYQLPLHHRGSNKIMLDGVEASLLFGLVFIAALVQFFERSRLELITGSSVIRLFVILNALLMVLVMVSAVLDETVIAMSLGLLFTLFYLCQHVERNK